MKRIIATDNAPKAVGPYSQAVLYTGSILELSGQIGIDPKTGKLVPGGIEAETGQVLDNIGAVLASIGWGFENIVKSRVYLTDIAHYTVVNGIYAKRFTSNPPARVALAVKQLPLGALIEIECTAAGDS